MWLEVLALAFFVMNARMKAPLTTPLLVLYGIISGSQFIPYHGTPSTPIRLDDSEDYILRFRTHPTRKLKV